MDINKEEFLHNLGLTQAYCKQIIQDNSKSVSTSKALRSLNLTYKGDQIFTFEWSKDFKMELVSWNVELFDENNLVLKDLFNLQMNEKKQQVNFSKNDIFKGKIFVSEFERVIADGISEFESDGLIDIDDLPPIDTWFYISKKGNFYLIYAWIPEKFEIEADNAIGVNCLDILYWSDSEEIFKSITNKIFITVHIKIKNIKENSLKIGKKYKFAV